MNSTAETKVAVAETAMHKNQIVRLDPVLVEELAAAGKNPEQAACALGTTISTFHRKRRDLPEIAAAWERGLIRAGKPVPKPMAKINLPGERKSPPRTKSLLGADTDFDVPEFTVNPDGVPAQIESRVAELIAAGNSFAREIRRELETNFGAVDYAHLNTALERLEMTDKIERCDAGMQTRFFPAKAAAAQKAEKLSAMAVRQNVHEFYRNNWSINPMKDMKFSNDKDALPLAERIVAAIRDGHHLVHKICVAVSCNALKVESEIEQLVIDGRLKKVRQGRMDAYFEPDGAAKTEVSVDDSDLDVETLDKTEDADAENIEPKITEPAFLIPETADQADLPKDDALPPKSHARRSVAALVTPERVAEASREGFTIREAAVFLGIAHATLKTYLRKPELRAVWDANRISAKSAAVTKTPKKAASSQPKTNQEIRPAENVSDEIAPAVQIAAEKTGATEQPNCLENFSPVTAVMVADRRLNETVERLKSEKTVSGLKPYVHRQSLPSLPQFSEAEQLTTEIGVVRLTDIEERLNDYKILARKTHAVLIYEEAFGEKPPRYAEVIGELEKAAR